MIKNVDEEISKGECPEKVNNQEVEKTRAKFPSRKTNDASYKDERIHQLLKSRSGHIGVLTKAYNSSQHLIVNDKGNVGDISLNLERFSEAWRKFVDVHEKYFVLLESDKQNACANYEEQVQQKLCVDTMVTEWRKMTKIERVNKFVGGSKCSESERSKSKRNKVSTSSSRLSTISKKKEEMALAQLKVQHLKNNNSLKFKNKKLKE